MAGKRKLTIEVVGDASSAARAFKTADDAGGKMKRGLGKLDVAVGTFAGNMAANIPGAIAQFGPALNEAGLRLDAIGVKSATVFGDSLGDVEKWAKGLAGDMGLTRSELTGLAADMGDLLKPLGFTSDEAAGMSMEMNELSGALSAWSKGTVDAEQVSQILTKAMLGETEGLKQLGISIKQSDIAARLAAKGQKGLTGEALAQAKAIATQELILEKSTDAQKAWTDGSMAARKAANRQSAMMSEMGESITRALFPVLEALMPVLEDVTAWLGDHLPEAIEVVTRWVEDNWPRVREAIEPTLIWFRETGEAVIVAVSAAWEQFGERIMTFVKITWDAVFKIVENALKVIKGVIDVVTGVISGDWEKAWNGVKAIFTGIWDGLTEYVRGVLRIWGTILDTAWENIKGAVSTAWEGIKTTVSDKIEDVLAFIGGIPGHVVDLSVGMFDGITDAFVGMIKTMGTKIADFILDLVGIPGQLVGKFSGMFRGIPNAFRTAINALIGVWNNFKFPSFKIGGWKLPGFLGGGTLPTWNTPTINFPDIPYLARGGVIRSRPGGSLFIGGEAGRDELVTPLRADGGLPDAILRQLGGARDDQPAVQIVLQDARFYGGPGDGFVDELTDAIELLMAGAR